MPDNKEYKFYLRVSSIASLLTFILFLIFSIILYFVWNNKLELIGLGASIIPLIVLSIITLLFFLMLLKTCFVLVGIKYYCKLTSIGLIISSLLSKKEVKFNEIKDVKVLSSKNVNDLVFKLYKQEKSSALVPAPIPKSKELKEINRYNTDVIGYGISYREIGSGPLSFPIFIKLLKPIVSKKEFILITLKNNTQYLLAPRKVSEFFNTYKKLKKQLF